MSTFTLNFSLISYPGFRPCPSPGHIPALAPALVPLAPVFRPLPLALAPILGTSSSPPFNLAPSPPSGAQLRLVLVLTPDPQPTWVPAQPWSSALVPAPCQGASAHLLWPCSRWSSWSCSSSCFSSLLVDSEVSSSWISIRDVWFRNCPDKGGGDRELCKPCRSPAQQPHT